MATMPSSLIFPNVDFFKICIDCYQVSEHLEKATDDIRGRKFCTMDCRESIVCEYKWMCSCKHYLDLELRYRP